MRYSKFKKRIDESLSFGELWGNKHMKEIEALRYAVALHEKYYNEVGKQ